MNAVTQTSAVSPEGLPVLAGVFALVDTHGVPLDLVLDQMKGKCLVDWVEFYFDAMDAGWNPKRLLVRIGEAVGDVYGPEYRAAVEHRLNLMIAAYSDRPSPALTGACPHCGAESGTECKAKNGRLLGRFEVHGVRINNAPYATRTAENTP